MKTSNKLLLGLLIMILVSITVFVAIAKYYQNADAVTGNGRSISEARQTANFNGIQVRGRINVYLTQGPERKVEVKGDQNLVSLIRTSVENDVLHIDTESKIGRNNNIEVNITVPSIKYLSFSDGSTIKTANELKGEGLQLESSSGGQATLTLEYKNLECNSNAGSILHLKGNVETIKIDASAGSIISAADLSAKKCSVQSDAGSMTEIKVLEELSADVSSGSMFTYSGEPTVRDINASSGGMIKKK